MRGAGGRLLDDLSGLAGGALSVAVGLRDECEAWVKARRELMLQRLDVARGGEVEALRELLSRVSLEIGRLAERLATLEARLAACEERLAARPLPPLPEGGGEPPSGGISETGDA